MCFYFGNTMSTWSSVIFNGLGMISNSMHKLYSSAAVRWHCQTVWHVWNCSLNDHGYSFQWMLACQVDVYCGVCSWSSVHGPCFETFETEAHIMSLCPWGVGGVYFKKGCNYHQESIVLHLQMEICEWHFVKVLHYFNKFGLCTVFVQNALILFTFMHLADVFIQNSLHCIDDTSFGKP